MELSELRLNGGLVEYPNYGNMEIAEKLSDRVIILNRGMKVAEGSLEELRNYDSLEEAFLKITGQHEGLKKVISAL